MSVRPSVCLYETNERQTQNIFQNVLVERAIPKANQQTKHLDDDVVVFGSGNSSGGSYSNSSTLITISPHLV